MKSEIVKKVDFSFIRYAQCWEDADVLNEALSIQPGDTCLSISSAGDNTLSLLASSPARVIALDLNPVQLMCLELRAAAYRELEYEELLGLMGSRVNNERLALYQRCRPLLTENTRFFWDNNQLAIQNGIGSAGKFERYFSLFRERILPLVHSKKRITQLLEQKDLLQRKSFYNNVWNNFRWRIIFRLFFSRFVMGRMGRDPSFFNYVEGSVADKILARTYHAMTELAPSENPYLHWILTGTHGDTLPFSLRKENFELIRDNLDKLEWHQLSIESFLAQAENVKIDKFNLSDIFEYVSEDNYVEMLKLLLKYSSSGSRLAYWNMLAPRSRPGSMAGQIQSLSELSERLHLKDKAFFYSRFVVEEVIS